MRDLSRYVNLDAIYHLQNQYIYIDEDQQENRYIFQYNLMVEINILESRKRDSVHFYEWHGHQKIYIVNE